MTDQMLSTAFDWMAIQDRQVYSVSDHTVTVPEVAVGNRNRNEVYDLALSFGAMLAELDTLELTETLRGVAAPHLDATGRALRASRRMRK